MANLSSSDSSPSVPDTGQASFAEHTKSLRVEPNIYKILKLLWSSLRCEVEESPSMFQDYYVRSCYHVLVELLARNNCTCKNCFHLAVNYQCVQKTYYHGLTLEWPCLLGRRMGILLSIAHPTLCWVTVILRCMDQMYSGKSTQECQQTSDSGDFVQSLPGFELWTIFHPRPDLKIGADAGIDELTAIRIATITEGYIRANPQRFCDRLVFKKCCAEHDPPITVGRLQKVLVYIIDKVGRS